MRELYEKVKNDSALLARVMEILSGADSEGAEKTQKALLAFAREQGHEVTIEEATAFFEGMQASGELSHEELDMVAGGKVVADSVILSIVTLGIGCAIASGIAEAVKSGACKKVFEI